MNTRSAIRGLLAGLAAAALLGCHHSGDSKVNRTMPPTVSYQTPVILATVGEPYASVVPDASAWVITEDVGRSVTTGFTFAVSPTLPAGLDLNTSTGVISGIPGESRSTQTYTVTCTNKAGTGSFALSLGVQQAASGITLAYTNGVDAASASVGANVVLGLPIVTGATATGFGVTPALPPGLIVNPDNGLVSGTPVAALAATTYTLVATTPTGSASAPFTLLVTATDPAAPAGLGYPVGTSSSAPVSLTVGQAGFSTTPTVSTGASLVYTVSPALPAGLVLAPTTGVISGTPTAVTAQAAYAVTASNASGNSQTDLYIVVN